MTKAWLTEALEDSGIFMHSGVSYFVPRFIKILVMK